MRHLARRRFDLARTGARARRGAIAASTGLALMLAALSVSETARGSDPEKGRVLAERLCAGCHMGGNESEKTGPTGIPAFRAVANRPRQTEEDIVKWLRSKPAMMPDHHISIDEAYDLAAFIMTLRTEP